MQSETKILSDSIRALCPGISDNEVSLFTSRFSFKELKKKDIFLQSGKIQRSIGFIVKGLVRSFYVNDNGDEITVGFYAETAYATHYAAFLKQEPSRYSIQCLEPTTLACLSFEDMQWIYQQSPTFERYGRIVAEEILKRQQSRIESFIFQTAEERYLHFIGQFPGLFNRISLSHLCSYLGVERQSLTRIRQKLAHQ